VTLRARRIVERASLEEVTVDYANDLDTHMCVSPVVLVVPTNFIAGIYLFPAHWRLKNY
jgi:hypothetical protein